MKRAWRLKSESDVHQVWQAGVAYAHPLMILRARPNQLGSTRVAFVVSKKVGHAVARNRAKRLMREAARGKFSDIVQGYDMVLIARPALVEAGLDQVIAALEQMLNRAHLVKR